ncbi:MAG: hypothetical protein IPL70_05075 [Uliginosibacterium sp.]|nr:hypothetical protein [Uliginosibacterium sp.]
MRLHGLRSRERDVCSQAFRGHLPIRRTVFNLEVAHNHSYFVGELGLWVHNTSGIDPSLLCL